MTETFPKSSSAASCCVWDVMCDGVWTTIKAMVQLTTELRGWVNLVEQMQDSIVTLIRHSAGSSPDCHYCGFTAGNETAAIPRVQGSLHMRALTPKMAERKWGRSQRRGDKGEVERSGGMGKSPQRWI